MKIKFNRLFGKNDNNVNNNENLSLQNGTSNAQAPVIKPILSIRNLTKKYKDRYAVNNISLDIYSGQIVGFLGANGAGKSTTIKMLTGLASITSGDAYIYGHSVKTDFEKAISYVGAMIEIPEFYPYLSGYNNLKFFAKLSGGVAVINVGAATEVEMKEKKLRIEDALNATKAAVEEGIVAGGGTAYVQAGIAAEKVVTELEGDEKTGAAIIAKALQAPLMQIAANAGLEGAVILNQVRGSEIPGYGFDAAKEEYCDMIAAGIVDPTKVCRSALENAASVASTVLTTEAMVVNIPEPPAPAPAAPDMGGMY